MAEASQTEQTGSLAVRNIGLLLSGDIENPILDADCILAENGRIREIGPEADLDIDPATVLVDAKGVALAPGLIDSHVHPVVGDYTPRQQQLNWIDSCLNGGVTTMVSAGEVHLPGRPRDLVGLKAMAIAAQRWYDNFRPSRSQGPGRRAGDRARPRGEPILRSWRRPASPISARSDSVASRTAPRPEPWCAGPGPMACRARSIPAARRSRDRG